MGETERKDAMEITNQLGLSQIMEPSQANAMGNVHGGEIMKLMDSSAAAVCIRYAKANCVTARVDEIDFHLPIMVGDLVTCTASLVYTGHSSLEVYVTVDTEDMKSGEGPRHALSAFFTMVCLGRDGKPKPVRPYTPMTPDEIKLHTLVEKRKIARGRVPRPEKG
jgi:acyl-CoA hydrolase